MFCTVSQAKNKFLTAAAPPGEEVWNFATLSVNRPWFFVSYSLRLPEQSLDESALLSLLKDLISLLKDDDRNIAVRAVLVVTPGEVNGSGNWKMEPLKAVWQGRDLNTDSPVVMYQLVDGRKYYFTSGTGESLNLSDLTCVLNIGQASEVEF